MTASHNKYTDNGLKVVDINGEYFDRNVELIYEEFINAKDFTFTLKKIIELMSNNSQSKYFFRDNKARLCLGYDTRRSCEKLKKHILYAFEILDCAYINYNIITTPQLHWLTYVNQCNFNNNKFHEFVTEDIYWIWLHSSYDLFHEMCDRYKIDLKLTTNYEKDLLIDCSCGASATKLEQIKQIFSKRQLLNLKVNLNLSSLLIQTYQT